VPPPRTANAARLLLADASRPPTSTVQQASSTPTSAQERPLIGMSGRFHPWGQFLPVRRQRLGQDDSAGRAVGAGAATGADRDRRGSRELAPNHPHVVRIEGRPANTELTGAISLTDLVRQSLRMRPDRLVVGEVRGAEICDLLTAMNTGHEGGCGTVHANSTADIPARLEALASLGGLPRPALHAQLAAALDAVIHVARDDSGSRRVADIAIFVREPRTGLVRSECAVQFRPNGGSVLGPGGRQLERMLER
jgi:Type II/IV secretion system protein